MSYSYKRNRLTALCKGLDGTFWSLHFATKMGNRTLKHVQTYMELQYPRQNQSLYNSNELLQQAADTKVLKHTV